MYGVFVCSTLPYNYKEHVYVGFFIGEKVIRHDIIMSLQGFNPLYHNLMIWYMFISVYIYAQVHGVYMNVVSTHALNLPWDVLIEFVLSM